MGIPQVGPLQPDDAVAPAAAVAAAVVAAAVAGRDEVKEDAFAAHHGVGKLAAEAALPAGLAPPRPLLSPLVLRRSLTDEERQQAAAADRAARAAHIAAEIAQQHAQYKELSHDSPRMLSDELEWVSANCVRATRLPPLPARLAEQRARAQQQQWLTAASSGSLHDGLHFIEVEVERDDDNDFDTDQFLEIGQGDDDGLSAVDADSSLPFCLGVLPAEVVESQMYDADYAPSMNGAFDL